MAAMVGAKSLPPAIVANLKSWIEPTEPFKIVGPIYYLGTRGLGAYPITTPDGHILLDGGMPSSAKDFEASIRKVGFRPEDIRLLSHSLPALRIAPLRGPLNPRARPHLSSRMRPTTALPVIIAACHSSSS